FPARLADSPKPVGIAPIKHGMPFFPKEAAATKVSPLPVMPALPNLPKKVEREKLKCVIQARRRAFESARLRTVIKDSTMPDKTRRQAFEEMLAEAPNDEFLRYGLGMEYASIGDLESAVRVFRELIALNPAKPYIPAIQMTAQSLLKLGRRNEVIA